MKVVCGGAHGTRGHGELGDQAQTAIPDYHGEVNMQEFASVAAFKGGWLGKYWVYRPKNPLVAASIARLMYRACNNPNIGYSNGNRLMIYEYGVDATIPIGCDCTSLTGYCIAQATGDSSIGHNGYEMPNNMIRSGFFYDPVPASSMDDDKNPLCTGDVIVSPKANEHMEVVVSGYSVGGASINIPPGTTPISGGVSLGSFAPRLQEPKPGEAAYEQFYKTNYCNSLNASYAWNRFSEILGEPCKLSKGPAERWYLCEEDGYQRGQSPNLGAVMCFTSTGGTGGLVCIVESVETDTVLVSMVSPVTNTFQTVTAEKGNGTWNIILVKGQVSSYFFQGFIYNPRVKVGVTKKSKFTEFIETAKSQIGNTGSFVKIQLNYDSSKPWSAAFIVACAKKVGGLLNVIIPNTYSCSSIGSIGVAEGMGRWYNGPANNGTVYPQAGDIALFRFTTSESDNRYTADKAGIVIQVDSTAKSGSSTNVSFNYVVGDSSGKVEQKTATADTKMFSGIFRPDWSKVDSLAEAGQDGYEITGYYSQSASSDDAVIKDYKYVEAAKSGSQPSITSGGSGLMLCAINHSALNGSIYSVFANMLSQDLVSQAVMNTSLGASAFNIVDPEAVAAVQGAMGSIHMGDSTGTCYLNDTTKTIFYRLRQSFGGNISGAIGFMGCMWAESCFVTSAENFTKSGEPYAAGLCQWIPVHGRRQRMEQHCLDLNGVNWRSNLEGQLSFIDVELKDGLKVYNNYYSPTLNKCTTCTQNLAGALDACRTVLTNFEGGTPVETYYPARKMYTEKLWILFFGHQEESGG